MDSSLAIVYLLVLLVLLGSAGIFVFQQVFKTRRSESTLGKLRAKLSKEKGTTQEYFELGSLYLSKKLTAQALQQFQLALKASETDPETELNLAPVQNAMGYAYFVQEQYDLAIRHYKDALQLNPDYVTALNNLGHAYEKKNLSAPALEAYEKVLALDPSNSIAKRRANSLRKRVIVAS